MYIFLYEQNLDNFTFFSTVYGKNQAGWEKAIFFGFLPFMYWVFLTTSNFLAWLEITIYVKKLDASHNM